MEHTVGQLSAFTAHQTRCSEYKKTEIGGLLGAGIQARFFDAATLEENLMSRSASLLLSVAAGCLISGANVVANADTKASGIPNYFFKEWKVAKDCTAEHAGPQGHMKLGQKFRMNEAVSTDYGQTFSLKTMDSQNRLLGGVWSGVKLEFRAGQKMTTVPADFECIPGEAASSPFLALGNYSSLAEPYYAYEHWYAVVNIHDVPHHLMIFPRDVTGADSAIIVLMDADSADTISLDHSGTIHTE
jgi:hypothetical protein